MKVLGKDKVIGRDVTVEEMIKVVEQDRPYYRRSGGGLTLSGGESLCQPEFARDMLRAAKERGINTALESMACAPFETIETILPYLDLYLIHWPRPRDLNAEWKELDAETWKALEEPVDIEPQTLTAPDRQGFTLVEWGGCQVV